MNRLAGPLVLMVLFEMGCNTIEDCQLSPFQDSVTVAFRTTNSIDFDSIKVEGIGRLSNDSIVGTLYTLPLDFEETEVTYGFYTDTTDIFLSLSYDMEVLIYDIHCEPQRRFTVNEIVGNIDSVVVSSNQIRNEFPVHFEVYF